MTKISSEPQPYTPYWFVRVSCRWIGALDRPNKMSGQHWESDLSTSEMFTLHVGDFSNTSETEIKVWKNTGEWVIAWWAYWHIRSKHIRKDMTENKPLPGHSLHKQPHTTLNRKFPSLQRPGGTLLQVTQQPIEVTIETASGELEIMHFSHAAYQTPDKARVTLIPMNTLLIIITKLMK